MTQFIPGKLYRANCNQQTWLPDTKKDATILESSIVMFIEGWPKGTANIIDYVFLYKEQRIVMSTDLRDVPSFTGPL